VRWEAGPVIRRRPPCPPRPRSLRDRSRPPSWRRADDLTYAMPPGGKHSGAIPSRSRPCGVSLRHVLAEVEFGSGLIVRAGVLLAHHTGALLGSPPLLWPGGVITADPRSFRCTLLCPCCSRAAAHLTEDEPSESHYFPFLWLVFRVKDAKECSNTLAYALLRFVSHCQRTCSRPGYQNYLEREIEHRTAGRGRPPRPRSWRSSTPSRVRGTTEPVSVGLVASNDKHA